MRYQYTFLKFSRNVLPPPALKYDEIAEVVNERCQRTCFLAWKIEEALTGVRTKGQFVLNEVGTV